MAVERWDDALPLGRWLEAVAAPQPLPAGGRVASLAAAFGAALVEKIGRIMLRSPRRAAFHPVAREVAERAGALRPLILAVGEADDRAYAAVMAAKRAPVSLPAPPSHEAELAAARLQVRLIAHCAEIGELAQRLEAGAGVALGADLATARYLARAAARSAHGNVVADLVTLPGNPPADAIRLEARSLLDRAMQATGASGHSQHQPDAPQGKHDPGDRS